MNEGSQRSRARRPGRIGIAWNLAAVGVVGCAAGEIEDPLAGNSGSPVSAPPQPGAAGTGARVAPAGGAGAPPTMGSAAATFAPAPAALRKLTVEQYRNSVADVLGV